MKLYQTIAGLLVARVNCMANNNSEWRIRHEDRINKLVADLMPSGSGIDNGTKLDFSKSKAERLVFQTAFHHMNDAGMYDGWTQHMIVVRPSLFYGIDLRITGRNRNDIREYLADMFFVALNQEVPAEQTNKEAA